MERCEEDDGSEISFTYLPGTDCVTSKLKSVSGEIFEREFFFYNKEKAVVKKVIDDGSSHSYSDLTDVTERHIQETFFQDNPEEDGFGLPIASEDRYLDLASGQEILLSRIEVKNSFDQKPLFKEVYDADRNLLYHLDYTYNDLGHLIRETTPLGNVIECTFDDRGRCTSETLVGSNKITFHTYDMAGRKIKVEDQFSDGELAITRFYYNLDNTLEREIDNYGKESFYTFDDLKRQTEKKVSWYDEKGRKNLAVEKTFYDEFDRPVEIVDPAGRITKRSYNSRGQLTKIIYPGGEEETFAYSITGLLIKKVGKDGVETTYSYNRNGQRVLEEVASADRSEVKTIHYTYLRGKLKEIVDPLGLKTCYEYDGAGRKIEERVQGVDGQERRTEYFWNAANKPYLKKVWTSDRTFIASYQFCDLEGREILSYQEDQEGKLLSKKMTSYDLVGNVIQEIIFSDEENSSCMKTIYNANSLPYSSTDALGQRTYFQWALKEQPSGSSIMHKTTIDPQGLRVVERIDARGPPPLGGEKEPHW